MVVMWDKNVLGNALDNIFGNVKERSLLWIVKWSTSNMSLQNVICFWIFYKMFIKEWFIHL